MTRQFCREKLGKNDEIYGEIRHCVTIYLGWASNFQVGGIYLRPLKVILYLSKVY